MNLLVGDDGANVLAGTNASDLIYGFNPAGPQADVTSVTATRVASGLDQPVFAGAPAGDLARLFIVGKDGRIDLLDLASGQLKPTPFLDLTGQISTGGEQGLLGLAFHPDFAQNGFFYVNLINPAGDTEIRRYQVSAANPDQADPASATLVISIDQPAGRTNHKAGWLDFGPDGYLYAALGDGGSSGDPDNNAQNPDSLLGKMLRLDVDADGFPADPVRNYAIPADNPFVGAAGADEIWALGLRNPWRNSFDRVTGELYIADVGQGSWEEINLGAAGANYQWDNREGPSPFPGGSPLSIGVSTAPIHSYDHGVGRSITGGYVYRGPEAGLQGQYFFADFIEGKIFTLRWNGAAWVATDRTAQITPDAGSIGLPSSFAEDGAGNLYVIDIDGEVFRLAPVSTSADQADLLQGKAGDDWLHGGVGNDTVDGGQGDDELQGGAGADTIIGGAGTDRLLGADGDDSLNGGAGIDAMAGGNGNDSYVVDHALDAVTEAAGAGNDIVRSSVSHALGANVEQLILIGAAPIDGTGNALANTLKGNSAANRLDGGTLVDNLFGFGGNDTLLGGGGNDRLRGGADNDTLTGGVGKDSFFFQEPAGAADTDLVTDFVSGSDRLYLDNAVYAALGAQGQFAVGDPRFHAAPGASTGANPAHRIVYDTASGALYYDADGDGGSLALLVATVQNGGSPAALAAGDVFVF